MLDRVRPEEALFSAVGGVVVTLLGVTGAWTAPSKYHGRIMLCFVVLLALAPALRVVRDFLPFVASLVLYGCLHDLTPIAFPVPADSRLVAIDRWVFGVDLAVWAGSFATPTLTWLMVFCYLSFFVVPGVLAIILYCATERGHFREYMVSLCCVAAVAYAAYLVVPVVGPYVYQAPLFPEPLPGSEATQRLVRTLDDLHGQARDCFPSLHVAATTCVLVFAWRHARRFFVLYLPIAFGLFVSTIYLRYHYGTDVIAGLATAAACVAVGPRLERVWS